LVRFSRAGVLKYDRCGRRFRHPGKSHGREPLAGRRSTALIQRCRPSAPRTRPNHSCRSFTQGDFLESTTTAVHRDKVDLERLEALRWDSLADRPHPYATRSRYVVLVIFLAIIAGVVVTVSKAGFSQAKLEPTSSLSSCFSPLLSRVLQVPRRLRQ
jgi:hypothetical protein